MVVRLHTAGSSHNSCMPFVCVLRSTTTTSSSPRLYKKQHFPVKQPTIMGNQDLCQQPTVYAKGIAKVGSSRAYAQTHGHPPRTPDDHMHARTSALPVHRTPLVQQARAPSPERRAGGLCGPEAKAHGTSGRDRLPRYGQGTTSPTTSCPHP